RDALEKFKAGKFDLVVTDNQMPEMYGTVLVQELIKINPDLPIIFMSGTEKITETQRIKNVSKPYKIDVFAKQVAELLKTSQSSSSVLAKTYGAAAKIEGQLFQAASPLKGVNSVKQFLQAIKDRGLIRAGPAVNKLFNVLKTTFALQAFIAAFIGYSIGYKFLCVSIPFLTSPYVAIGLIIAYIGFSIAKSYIQNDTNNRNLLMLHSLLGLAAWTITAAVFIPMVPPSIMLHGGYGRAITYILAFGSIRFITSLIINYRGGYKTINLPKLTIEQTKEEILRVVPEYDQEKVEELIKNITDANILHKIYRELLKIAKRSPAAKEGFQEARGLLAKLGATGVELAEELSQAYQESKNLLFDFSGKQQGMGKILSWTIGIPWYAAYFFLRIIVLFFARYGLRNADLLRKRDNGLIKVDNAVKHIKSIIIQAREEDTAVQKIGDKWFEASLRFPLDTGNLEFIFFRALLAVLSGYLGHVLGSAWGMDKSVGIMVSFYDLLGKLFGISFKQFFVMHLTPTWA
ncbi:MAG: response regulator, partial [Candidatus Omnitrophota bacterium]|nr:response regulator [Candidatus Omnitrophota bacterium]